MNRRSRNFSDERQAGQQRNRHRSQDMSRDRSRFNEWSPSSDYTRFEGGQSSSRYGTSDSYRGQGRDLHYDETGRGYGDSYRNPGDYDERSYRGSQRSDRGNDYYDVSRSSQDYGSRNYGSQSYGAGQNAGYGSQYGNTYESGRGFNTDSRRSYSDDQGYSRGNVNRNDYGSREGYRSESYGRHQQQDERVNRPLRGRGSDWNENDRNYIDESERDESRFGDRYY